MGEGVAPAKALQLGSQVGLNRSEECLSARSHTTLGHESRQFGNGFRADSRNMLMSRRIERLRMYSASTNRCRVSRSPSYHSSGMSAAHRQMVSESISSAMVKAGSNESQLVTPWYTQLFACTPLNG